MKLPPQDNAEILVAGKALARAHPPAGCNRACNAAPGRKIKLGCDGNFSTGPTHPDRAEATRVNNYPLAAIEEALANAVYHRSYEEREPIEVRITREEMVIVSYPGPDRSLRLADLQTGRAVARRYRNRRIGEFLKELDLTEGRSTGIPKMLRVLRENGSPAPVFETDDDRAALVLRLPVHAEALAVSPPSDHAQSESGPSAARVGTESGQSQGRVRGSADDGSGSTNSSFR